MANHNFNITLAKRYGIEEAILIEHIYWWIHKNECEEVEDMVHEGAVWCRSTARGFAKYIPYMKPDKIWRILKKLEGRVLRVGNFNRQALNQTLWYTFTDDFVKELKELDYDFENIKNAILKNEKSNNIINNILIEDKIIEDKEKEDNNKSLSSKNKRFSKPTIEQIEAYIKERKLHFDAEQFFDYYEGSDWMRGKTKIKDWKAACRTWEHNRKSQKEEKEEDSAEEETLYPEGMDAEQWNEITMWMCNKVPLIADKIDPISFGQMKDMAGDSKLFSELLKQVNEDFSLDSSHTVKSVFYKRLKEYRNGQKG